MQALASDQTDLTLDRGLHYGHGLFETILFVRKKCLLYDWHLARLVEGCRRLDIQLSEALVIEKLKAVLESFDTGVVKLIVTAGQGKRGYASERGAGPNILVIPHDICFKSNNLIYKHKLLRAKLCSTRLARQPLLAGMKHLNRLESVLAANELRDTRFQEGFLLDSEGLLIEAVSGNIFLYDSKSQVLLTPPLTYSGVAGVMRQFLVDQQSVHGIQIEIKPLTLDDLDRSSEVFITNAIAGIQPVVGFDGKRWALGPVTIRLQQFLNRKWQAIFSERQFL